MTATQIWGFNRDLPQDMDNRLQEVRQFFWDMIAPEDNWKNPIRATIPQWALADCQEAARWFAGCDIRVVAEVSQVSYTVEGPGYYAAVGA